MVQLQSQGTKAGYNKVEWAQKLRRGHRCLRVNLLCWLLRFGLYTEFMQDFYGHLFFDPTGLQSMPTHTHRNQMIFSPSKGLPHNVVAPASQSAATKYFTTKPYFNPHTDRPEQSLTHSEPPISPVVTPPDQFPGQSQTPAAWGLSWGLVLENPVTNLGVLHISTPLNLMSP